MHVTKSPTGDLLARKWNLDVAQHDNSHLDNAQLHVKLWLLVCKVGRYGVQIVATSCMNTGIAPQQSLFTESRILSMLLQY